MDNPATPLSDAAAKAIAEIRRREAELARLTATNAELVEALEEAIGLARQFGADAYEHGIAGIKRGYTALARAKEASHDPA